MIIVADSGSTKTDWAFASGENQYEIVSTAGINPVLMSRDEIAAVVADAMASCLCLPTEVTHVFFYGAGCRAPYAQKVEEALQKAFPLAQAEVNSDLLGAARALVGRGEGIACILGTGSNSCVCHGGEIVATVPPMGYVLGDEGSGAALGKRLLNGLYKGWLSEEVRRLFEKETGLTLTEIISRVYQQPMPSRFLASLVPFIANNRSREEINTLITSCLSDFFKFNVLAYNRRDLAVSFVGGIATVFAEELRQVAQAEGYRVGTILRRPIEVMLSYHHSR